MQGYYFRPSRYHANSTHKLTVHVRGVGPVDLDRGVAVVHALVRAYHWLDLVVLEPMLLGVAALDLSRTCAQQRVSMRFKSALCPSEAPQCSGARTVGSGRAGTAEPNRSASSGKGGPMLESLFCMLTCEMTHFTSTTWWQINNACCGVNMHVQIYACWHGMST